MGCESLLKPVVSCPSGEPAGAIPTRRPAREQDSQGNQTSGSAGGTGDQVL